MSQQSSDAFRNNKGDPAPTPSGDFSPQPLERDPMSLRPEQPQPLERESHDPESDQFTASGFNFGDDKSADASSKPNPFAGGMDFSKKDPAPTAAEAPTVPAANEVQPHGSGVNDLASQTPEAELESNANADRTAVNSGEVDPEPRPVDELGTPIERREFPRGPLNSADDFLIKPAADDSTVPEASTSENASIPEASKPTNSFDSSYRGEPTRLGTDEFSFGDEPASPLSQSNKPESEPTSFCSDPDFNPTPPRTTTDNADLTPRKFNFETSSEPNTTTVNDSPEETSAESNSADFSEYVAPPESAVDPFDEHAHGFDNPTESISGAESDDEAAAEDAFEPEADNTIELEPEIELAPESEADLPIESATSVGFASLLAEEADANDEGTPALEVEESATNTMSDSAVSEPVATTPEPTFRPETGFSEQTEPQAATPIESAAPAQVSQPDAPKVFDASSQPKPTAAERDFQPAGSPFATKRTSKADAPKPGGAMSLNMQPPQPTRPDNLPKATAKSSRRSHLPRTYGVWWAATLVFFVLAAALGGYHALEYANIDPFKLHYSDLRDQKIFMILGGAMLGALFAVWLIQNTAKGLTLRKSDPEGSYNNVYGVLVCLLIVGGLKFSNDIITQRAAAADGGQLAWLRANAYGVTDPRHEPAPPEFATTPPKATADTTGSSDEAQTVSQVPETEEAAVSPFSKAASDAQPNRPRPGTGQLQLGGATGAVMSKAIRTYQTAAGQARRADNTVNATPTPDLRIVNNSGAIEKVALAHADAFIAHRDLARMAASLPNTTRESLLQAGASMDQTEEQIWVLTDLLKLDRAAEVHRAQAAVHAAQAAYAGYLAEHFGGWEANDGIVRFEDAELGAIARDMQASIETREQELTAARIKFVGS